MVVKDIEKGNSRLLIEEQLIGNRRYRICDSYVPELNAVLTRITVSTINENDSDNYEQTHGVDLRDDKIKSFYLVDDINGSTHKNEFLQDDFGYYQEVIKLFDELINSGKSEFTDKALSILNNVKLRFDSIGSIKNGI